jgi:hypothetical protein
MDNPNIGCARRMVIVLLIIFAIMLGCGAIGSLVANRFCTDIMSQRLPIYPGATLVSEQHNLFSAFGIGETLMILHSPDPDTQVRDWYSHTVGEYNYNEARSPDFGYRISRAEWVVDPDAQKGGSTIYLHGTCFS